MVNKEGVIIGKAFTYSLVVLIILGLSRAFRGLQFLPSPNDLLVMLNQVPNLYGELNNHIADLGNVAETTRLSFIKINDIFSFFNAIGNALNCLGTFFNALINILAIFLRYIQCILNFIFN